MKLLFTPTSHLPRSAITMHTALIHKMHQTLLIVILIFICRLSFSQTSNVITWMPAGTWYQIPKSTLDSANLYPNPLPPGNTGTASVMSAWSGATYDTKRRQLIVWGGGHQDYAGNEIYVFDMNSLSWSRTWGPTPNGSIHALATDNCTTCYQPFDSVTTAYNKYNDGNPSARHTYSAAAYVPDPVDAMFYPGNGFPWERGDGTNTLPLITWLYHIGTTTWEDTGANWPLYGSDSLSTSASAYNPNTGSIVVRGAYFIRSFNPVAKTWTTLWDDTNAGGWSTDPHAAIDPINNRFYLLGSGHLVVFNMATLAAPNDYQVASLSGDTEIVNVEGPGLIYDPTINKLVAYGNSAYPASVYVIDPNTLFITRLSPIASNTATPARLRLRGRGDDLTTISRRTAISLSMRPINPFTFTS